VIVQPDEAAVASARQAGEVSGEVDHTGARWAPPGCVGDLDVPDVSGVGVDHRGDVVAIDVQMVNVGQQPQR